MASLKVAVRVRPFNQRERDMGAKLIIQMDGKKTRIVNSKVKKENDTNRDRSKEFTFDYSYWSFDSTDSQYTSQDEVYNDLGVEVIDSAFEGYNACVFAYGQTGSGKTYTMMGSADSLGLIPRICKTLFARMKEGSAAGTSYRTEVSYLEIYNERVKDLLRANTSHSLKIREHPKKGPYVENLSRHLVSEYTDIEECMIRGSAQRTTASTNMNDVSSRSHAIFTIMFVQAGFSNDMPSETVSKVHLVDLAGSERADATGATGQRLKEGAHINKSLVTLGSVISALAELSSHQANEIVKTRSIFIPYRDSVLTWLLKDSLGGNSKTIMIAAISPADCNYGETLSTLRYANRAKNIINKPTINEDANVKLIRELRDEISKLKALILSNNDLDSSLSSVEASVLAQLHKKQAQEKVLTEEWATKWRETQLILQEQRALGLRKADGGGGGVVLDSDAPHLVGIDDDVLSTGVALYQLRDGQTRVGRGMDQDIVLTGAGVEHKHCVVTLDKGVAMLEPVDSAQCWVNTVLIDKPTRLTQGCIILLGRTNMFRYNDPVEAAKLRKSGSRSQLNLSRLSLLSWSTTDLATSTENLLTDDHHHHHNQDNLDAQRATLQREKDAFAQQQREREIDWAAEQKARRDALDVAQRLLEDEKQRMEADYRAQCRRLADDWRKLEEKQQENAAALQRRELELQQKKELLEWERNEMMAQVEAECRQIAAIEAAIVTKQHVFSELLSRTLSSLTIECSASKIERLLSQSQGTPLSEEDSEFLYNLLQGADQESVEAIKDLISQHKKELASLESDLQVRIELLSTHRENVDRIESELSDLSEEQLTPPKIGPAGDSNSIESQKQDIVKRTNQQMQELLDKKKSLTLNLKRVISPLNESTENSISNSSDSNVFSSTTYEDTASKHTSEYSTPLKTSETFHTAMSSCGCNQAVDNQECCTHLSTHVVVLNDSGVDIENANNNKKSENNNAYNAQYLSDTYNIPTCSDSDDNPSSVEDCKVISTEEGGNSAQSSSSFEKVSPLECFRQRKNLRQVGREGGIRAMKRLCQRMARQKLVIVRNIETECSREELNEQISVLQELQRQYVKLEIALQGHTNASSDDKNILSPTTEHPLNNVFDNSAVEEMNKFVSPKSENCNISSPDSESKKFLNGTENYNISPDIILHVKNDPCCSKDQSNLVNSATSYSKIINNDDTIPNMSKDLETKRKSFNLIEYRRNSSLSSDKEGMSEEEPAVLECGAASVVSVSSGDSDTRVKSVYLANQNINSGSLLSLTRSLPTFAAYENSGHAISVPTYVLRGSGSKTHFEYEVRINVQGERWSLLRRYRRFRELHLNMKSKYGAKIDAIPFPPRQLFSSTSEPVARQRRGLLEAYLRRLLTVCMTLPNCPLYCPSQLKDGPTRPVCEIINKLQLLEFSAFFKRGTFESGKYGTS